MKIKDSPNKRHGTEYNTISIREYCYRELNGAIFGYWMTLEKHPVTWENDYTNGVKTDSISKEYSNRVCKIAENPYFEHEILMYSYNRMFENKNEFKG